MTRLWRGAVTLALASTVLACSDAKDVAFRPNPDACLDDLSARVTALRGELDALEVTSGPAGARGKKGKTGPSGAQGPAGESAEDGAYGALLADLDELEDRMTEFESALAAAEAEVVALSRKPQELMNAMSEIALPLPPQANCGAILQQFPGAESGEYLLDADGAGPGQAIETWCDFQTDGGGYGWVRITDAALDDDQSEYAAKCAEYGMEIVVPRTKAHALALAAKLGEPPNLVNVFPKSDGAVGLANFTGICQGAPCSFWLTDGASADCQADEPSGDNLADHRLYRFDSAALCDYGRWNDFYNDVDITGWVVCSPNDK